MSNKETHKEKSCVQLINPSELPACTLAACSVFVSMSQNFFLKLILFNEVVHLISNFDESNASV